MISLLGNDLVVNENDCNLGCRYCLTGQSNLKATHRQQLIFQPPRVDTYRPDGGLGERMNTVVSRVRAELGAPLLKVTGGEVFLVRGIMDFLEEQARRHATLVVQTNATLVRDEHLDAFRSWGNVVLQVSLDSHAHAGNSYRVPRLRQHERLIGRVRAILDADLPVEVYAVLNDRSVEHLEEFAEWLRPFDRAVLYPFPVRGPDAAGYRIRPDQLPGLERFCARYDALRDVLPPKAYLDRLLSFYREGGRTFGCHLPRLVISTFSDGTVTPCPNIWFSDLGGLLTDDWRRVMGRVGNTGLYRALLAPTPRLDACKGCFTPWDLLSMYLDDVISIDELCAAPTYAHPVVRRVLMDLRKTLEDEIAEVGHER